MKLRCTLFFLFFLETICFSQHLFLNKISVQDSSIFNKRRVWVDLGAGPSITLNPSGLDVLVLGTTIDFTFIDKYNRLIKVESSYHQGIAVFENFY